MAALGELQLLDSGATLPHNMSMRDSSDVKAFYDQFASDTLLKDFFRLNLRQEAIKELCDAFVPDKASVLEVGCGVGIIARHVQKRAERVVGIDISDNNIAIATAYASAPNTVFRVLDVIEQARELEPYGRFDAVLLPDVIEHIPKERYPGLFKTIEKHLAPNGRVLLTYPSPDYQEHLKSKSPESRQVVDETVQVTDLLAATTLKPVYLRYRDVWHQNQYVHLVLAATLPFGPRPIRKAPVAAITYRLRKYRWRLSNLAFLRRMRRRDWAKRPD